MVPRSVAKPSSYGNKREQPGGSPPGLFGQAAPITRHFPWLRHPSTLAASCLRESDLGRCLYHSCRSNVASTLFCAIAAFPSPRNSATCQITQKSTCAFQSLRQAHLTFAQRQSRPLAIDCPSLNYSTTRASRPFDRHSELRRLLQPSSNDL